ncbi:MAG: biopolymer transporter ExbD [Parachlamydiales bacterium]|jgi:biopolymer transport protein ExbD
MSHLIEEEQLGSSLKMNLAPMLDFLFLMLSFFATLAITRATLFDTKLDLVRLKKESHAATVYNKEGIYQINLSVDQNGLYKWITEIQDYPMGTLNQIQNELIHQYNIGLLPKNKAQTEILLHIDKQATWEAVSKLIFTIRQVGFEAKPIYKPALEVSEKHP